MEPTEDRKEVCDGCWTRGFCEDQFRIRQKCKCRCLREGWQHTDYLMRTELEYQQ